MLQLISTTTKAGYLFQIDEPARVQEIKDQLYYRKYFTEGASVPDLNPPKLALYVIGYTRGQADMVAIGVHTGTPTTMHARIKLKRPVAFQSIRLPDLISNESDQGRTTLDRLMNQNKALLQIGTLNELLRNIARANPDK